MKYLKQLIVPALTALVVVLLVLHFRGNGLNAGTASVVGSTPIPTTLSGGSSPSVFNALEATESFISDGPAYLLGNTFYGSTAAASGAQQQYTVGTFATGTSTLAAIA